MPPSNIVDIYKSQGWNDTAAINADIAAGGWQGKVPAGGGGGSSGGLNLPAPPSPPNLAQVEPYRLESEQAAKQAVSYGQAGELLPSMLRDALAKKLTIDNPLIAQRGEALGNFMTAAEGSAAELLGIQQGGAPFSPTQLRSLQGQREAAALVPLANINYMLSQVTGSIPEIVNSVGQVFRAGVIGSQGAADIARQGYLDRLNILLQQGQLTRENYLDNVSRLVQQATFEQDQQRIDLTKKQVDAELAKPNRSIIESNGRNLLIDSITGDVIKDLGSSINPKATGDGSYSMEELLGLLGGFPGGEDEPKPASPPDTGLMDKTSWFQQQLNSAFGPSYGGGIT